MILKVIDFIYLVHLWPRNIFPMTLLMGYCYIIGDRFCWVEIFCNNSAPMAQGSRLALPPGWLLWTQPPNQLLWNQAPSPPFSWLNPRTQMPDPPQWLPMPGKALWTQHSGSPMQAWLHRRKLIKLQRLALRNRDLCAFWQSVYNNPLKFR